ncbi:MULTISPECIES: prepilin peptidase [Rhodanobacteraceae]|uniref:prepilin peptidase n=1 Tax=Rhodanobacteraceae TaxID=1775411 RepID=UPI00055DC4E2|nr:MULTISPECIES: A24 family peptidase [Rhodanobacteraceae]MDR6644532.1 leader peptidase (prepilin peptidase)/N-methyltransferase [Luteibacter sp. 1214]SDG79085.1 leader peptidase (prepilin peptidase) / N-methyltransferase [Dyella sp. 333MFSha]SKB42645.1 leader peptidase (prepilin peptidase) / N-methyltransferase [Luteibacter sp. 22Crub2.1]
MPDLPLALWIGLAGVFGLLFGSFLNVVILRVPARMQAEWRKQAREVLELDAVDEALPPGVVKESSHCPKCKHPLAARDNIPLFGWLMLRGRCRYCHEPISIQYPLVELLAGLASAAVVWRFGPTPGALAGLVLTYFLIALSGIDARTQLLPDELNYPLLWIGLGLCLIPSWQPLPIAPTSAILAALLGYLSLWSVYWLFKLLTGKEGMGHGDFKLLAALGAWMGPVALLPIVMLSSLIGAIVGGALILFRRHGREVPIPFGPYLAAAGWVWFLVGDRLLALYMQVSGIR